MTSSESVVPDPSPPDQSGQFGGWTRWAVIVSGVALLVPLATAAYVGTFSRYLADDFCTLGSLRDFGFWGSQAYWYTTWSGRFAFTFVVNVVEGIGEWLVPLLPAIHIVALVLAVGWVFHLWLHRTERTLSRLTGWFIGGLVVFETLGAAPNVYQSVYWQTGVLTYVAPLVILALFAAWLFSRPSDAGASAGTLLLSSGAMAVAVGFSETVGSLIVAALAGSLVLIWLVGEGGDERACFLRLLGAGLAGAVLGMVVVAAAPGNASRQALLTPSSGFAEWLGETTRNAYIFSVKTLKDDPLRLALGLVLPFLLGAADRPKVISTSGDRSFPTRGLIFLATLPVFTFGLVMACMAPTQYAMSSYPDGRLLISASFAVAVGMALWGVAAGRWIRRVWPASAWPPAQAGLAATFLAVVLLGYSSLGVTRELLAPLPDARDFAARSDERLGKVLEASRAGVDSLPVASLTHMGGLDEISTDSSNWVNVCFAQAYGLQRVTAK